MRGGGAIGAGRRSGEGGGGSELFEADDGEGGTGEGVFGGVAAHGVRVESEIE